MNGRLSDKSSAQVRVVKVDGPNANALFGLSKQTARRAPQCDRTPDSIQ